MDGFSLRAAGRQLSPRLAHGAVAGHPNVVMRTHQAGRDPATKPAEVEAGPPPRKNRSALDLGEADVQAEAAQHPDEPEGGQEGPCDDATYGDGGGEQFNYLC
jgi:hypothetical protein